MQFKKKSLQSAKFLIDLMLSWNFLVSIIESLTKSHLELKSIYIRTLCGYAYRLLHRGKFNRSIYIADRVLLITEDSLILDFLSPIYRLNGDLKKSVEVSTKAEQLRREIAKSHQLDKLNIRVFSRSFTSVGHTALIDIFLKAQVLGIIKRKNNIILGELSSFANPCLMKYWENHCRLIDNQKIVNYLTKITYPIEENLASFECSDGKILNLEEFAMKTQLQWESENRNHLINLTDEHKKRGYELLHKIGVPKGGWFCGLHVREGNDDLSAIRNAKISSYMLAIEEISKMGGWVIRLGDKSMQHHYAPGLNYIDYVFSEHQSDWMDVFIWSEGRFFIGTGSGPSAIPICFGKPVAFSNWGPLGKRQWGKIDLFLPKIYVYKSTQIPLTMEERLYSHFAYHESYKALESMGVEVLDNSPEEIKDLISEMYTKINSNQNLTPRQILQKKRFANLSIAHNVYPSDLANAFIDRYPNF